VELTGSLKEGAALLGMAYSKARRIIDNCEHNLGFALLVRKKGGASGGGSSEVTAEAAALMKKYESLRADVEEAVGETYKRHFGKAIRVQFYVMITQKRKKEV
jgi:molybdate transport repressor ModE-like protein